MLSDNFCLSVTFIISVNQFTITDDNNMKLRIHLKDALLAPTIPTSLFSFHAATQKGAKVNFSKEKNILTVDRTTLPIMPKGRLYFLKTTNASESMNTAKSLPDWHRALAHMNTNDIIGLEKVTMGMTIIGA